MSDNVEVFVMECVELEVTICETGIIDIFLLAEDELETEKI